MIEVVDIAGLPLFEVPDGYFGNASLAPGSVLVANLYFVFHGPIPNAPGFGFFASLPQITGYRGGYPMIQGYEHLILPLDDVAEATTEQLNKIDRRWFNIPNQPPATPPPLFQ